MSGPAKPNPVPVWMRPENASVLDSPMEKAIKLIASMIGADDPQGQVMALMNPTELVGGSAPLAKAIEYIAKKIKPIRAYHGSPHDFDRFSLDKIGTGEGAQAYGHGLYFAENPAVAEEYRNTFMKTAARSGQAKNAIDVAERLMAEGRTKFGNRQYAPNDVMNLAQDIEEKIITADLLPPWAQEQIGIVPKARMYEVDIHADPADFLDWDAPLSQQNPKIQGLMQQLYPEHYAGMKQASDLEVQIKALAEKYAKPGDSYKAAIERAPKEVQEQWRSMVAEQRSLSTASPGRSLPTSGESIYRQLPDQMADRGLSPRMSDRSVEHDAAEALRAQGIPGIKYYDQASRGAKEGTRNYVVFDDKLISIVKKYGIAGALGAGLIDQTQAQQLKDQGYQ
jgi:hypothetical protein